MQQMFQCPKCSSQNVIGQPFCGVCGERFQYNCPQCGGIVDSRFNTCPNCRGRLYWPTQQQTQPLPESGATIYQTTSGGAYEQNPNRKGGAGSLIKTILKVAGGIVLGFVILGVIGIVLIGRCLPPPPKIVTPTSEAPPPAQEKPEGKLIKDLAYVEGSGFGYRDSAVPEFTGVQISFLWYDSKSNLITFSNIPISVDIELYPRGFDFNTGKYTLEKCIYKGQAQIDSSSSYIRIPFKKINAAPTTTAMYFSVAKVTIHTPQQGDYSIEAPVGLDFKLD